MFKSAIGAKVIMAVTGLLLFGFLIAHLAGNLMVFGGPNYLNGYAMHLRDFGPLLWVARLGLLAVLVVHLLAAFSISRRNANARPEPYAYQPDFPKSNALSRHMLFTGMVILAFLVFHLAHYTFFLTHPQYKELHWTFPDGKHWHDVYAMVIEGFRVPWLVGLYFVAQIFLWMHLSHALSSVFQTLGFRNPRNDRFFAALGPAVATVLSAGYLSIPLAVLLRVIGPVTNTG